LKRWFGRRGREGEKGSEFEYLSANQLERKKKKEKEKEKEKGESEREARCVN
jgi:hypothetical protein